MNLEISCRISRIDHFIVFSINFCRTWVKNKSCAVKIQPEYPQDYGFNNNWLQKWIKSHRWYPLLLLQQICEMFWLNCAFYDTSMKFGTHLENVNCSSAIWYRRFAPWQIWQPFFKMATTRGYSTFNMLCQTNYSCIKMTIFVLCTPCQY